MGTFTAGFSNVGQTSADFSATFSGGDSGFVGYRYVKLSINGTSYDLSYYGTGGYSSFSKTVSGLSVGTSYSWSAYLGYKANGESSITWLSQTYYKSGTLTTKSPTVVAPTGSISGSQVKEELKISVNWSVTANGNNISSIWIQAKGASGYYDKKSVSGTYGNGVEIEVDHAGDYYIRLAISYSGGTVYSNEYPISVTLSSIDEWQWYSYETNAFNNNGAITNLTRDRWNAFIDKANDAIKRCNKLNKSSLSPISYTMGTDKIMYAYAFCNVVDCINRLCWQLGVNDTNWTSSNSWKAIPTSNNYCSISSGDIIYGYYFTNLSAALNRAISAMS